MSTDVEPREDVFEAMYADGGRPSAPPERLLKGSLLIAPYSLRSERQLCEPLEYTLLFRWFLGMDMLGSAHLGSAFAPSTFSKNRARMMEHDVAAAFFATIRDQASALMSREHFSVDGTRLQAWASIKSFRPKEDTSDDNNGWADFRGRKRSHQTHESKTAPEASVPQRARPRSPTLLHGSRPDGEPPWPSERRTGHRSDGLGGAPKSRAHEHGHRA